ncbi:MAG: PKD domain-containing protein [Nitrospira sp.]
MRPGRADTIGAFVLLLSSLIASAVFAQTGTLPLDSYLHGSGGTANPPTLTADLLPSISLTPKTKDSAALNFSGGNPWQALGTWTPPTGSSGSVSITALGPAHLWTGLKASGDVGGKIDLLTEVLVNGGVISSGLTRCVSGLTASALTPQDITVALGAIPVTTLNPATQSLVIRVSARMGTTATNAACGTKTSVTGVRLYFDSLLRLSRLTVTFQTPPPVPVAVIPDPFRIKAGTTANVIAILFPVSLQASTSATVSSSDPGIATVPETVPVSVGQLFLPIPVTGVSAGATQVAVTLNGKTAYSTVTVIGGAAAVTSLTPPSLSITQGGTGSLTVSLNAVQSATTTVMLTSSAASIASVPATVTVQAGQLSATIPVAANTAGQVDITASLNGTSATSHVTVTPVLPTVVAVQPTTSQVVVGANTTLTVTLSSAQVAATTVTLTANPGGVVSMPAIVVIPANQTQASFSVSGLAVGTAMVTATLNSSSATAAVDVMPPALQLTALQPPTQSIVATATGTLSVVINAMQSTPTDIALSVDNPALLTIPLTVTVPPNQLTASFTVIGKATGLATITATLGSVTKTATVIVTPQPPQVAALLPPTLNVIQGATGSLTLTLNAAQVSDTAVPLTNSSATVLDVPPSVIIPSGFTSVSLPVAGLALGTATVTATLNGAVTSTITVVPPPALVTALGPVPPAPAPLTLAKGRAGVLQVTLSRVPTDPIVVSLTNANANLVTIPATVTVPAGQQTAEFPVTTQQEGTASITASVNSSSQTAQVVVMAAEVNLVTVAPSTPTAFAGESLLFTATAIMTDGTTQPLTTGLTWTSTNPAVTIISSTGLATTLTAGTTTIRAATVNSLGPISGETTLTVQTPPTLMLAPATANLLVGQSVTLTLTSAVPAPVGGLPISFSFTGPGTVTFNPLSLLIPAGQASGTVQITATGGGTTTVTASAPGRLPGSSALTLTNPVPTLATINPTQVAAAGPPVTLTLTGTNFVSTSVIQLDGAPLATTLVSATQLTALVPISAIAVAHAASVTVSNPAPGGGTSAPLILNVVNALPVLTSLSPSQVVAGSAAFTLFVNGSNFVSASTVVLDGQTLVTAFVSASQLTAQVPVTAVTPARSAQVTVTNPAPGGGVSNVLPLIINTPPVANAGRPQSATVGLPVTLDGRNSLDADGDLLTFSWVLASRPAGSGATLLNPTIVRPSFTPDVAGSYQLELTVNDGKVLSAPAVVTVTAAAPNAPANPEPGPNRAALIGQPVTLDGRLSTDPEDSRLRYTWTILSAPLGSAAPLTNNTSVQASLTPDLAGDYLINLVVNDGTQDSAPVAVKISATSGNAAPQAEAGRDRNLLASAVVTLDGSASRDPNPGTTLTYTWTLLSAPLGSSATLTNPTTIAPTFTPTVTGLYLVQLVVNDGLVDSPPSVVLLTVASPNAAPNADAGVDQRVAQTEVVTVNGTGSTDPNSDPLTYQWSLVSVPTGSTTALVNPTAAQPTFAADLSGFYVARLIVTDSTGLSSAPALVVIKAQAVTALAVTPVNPSIQLGQTQAFVATATMADNSTKVLTASVTWASSVPAVATINANGLATSVAFGTTGITAAAGTITSPVQTLRVLPLAPTITTVTPTTGPIGTAVTITGTNLLGNGPGTTTVTFNTANAVLTAVTATSITTTVPQGATTGLITITTPGGTAVGPQPFTVTTSQDFTVAAAPGAVSVVRGQPTTAQIQVTNGGPNPVTGFVSLAATGLPAGMSGAFTPTQIAGGQVATLTLNSGAAPTGLATITISATAVIDGQTIIRQSPLQINVLAAGTTTLAGRILATKDDAPIPGARVKLGALSALTDASGNFLFSTVPTGPQVLLIDGPSALYPGDLPVPVTITPNIANILSYPVYLHEVSLNYFPLVPGQATVVQPPDIPDFSMIIPAGTTIMGWDGQPNVKVSVTRVPIDRLPLPPIPPDVATPWVYMFNFGKSGGGYPSRPIPIVFPNETGSAPGTRVDLWYYDESPTPDATSNQWKIYGQGTVSADGLQIVPDPGVGQPKFCCGGGFPAPAREAKGPGTDTLAGDPVSISTGMFHLEVTDLVLPGRIPVVIRRGYRSQIVPPTTSPRRFPRTLVNLEEFGINTALLEYNDRLTFSAATVIYTTGFERSMLTRSAEGVYTSNRAPFLRGLVVRVNQDGSSTLREKNGTIRSFGADGWLQRITDRNGNAVTIVRNGSQIQQILEPGGRALTFTYSGGLISQITDPLGRTVRYTYEINPTPARSFTRLKEVTNPANGVTRYDYNPQDCITGVTDARGIQYLTNEYIQIGTEWAVSRQTQVDGGVWQFNYILNGLTVTQATVLDPRSHASVSRFNGLGFNIGHISAQGQVSKTSRDYRTNDVMEVRDPLNRLTKYTYDLAGNVNSVLDPQQNPTIFEYETNFNRVTKITDALNQNTRFTYDPSTGNLLTTTDPLNHATAISYNQFGQPISVTDALGNVTQFEYDEVGNLIATVDPLGNRMLRFYDAVSRLVAMVDARGKSTQFTYDALNRVTQIQDAINGITGFTYDPNGNLLTVSDAKNQVTTYTYDNMDRLATRKDALNRIESYQYDPAGNLTTFTDRKGQQTTFQYDALNRRISATYADATTTFTYDSVGRLIKASDTAPSAGTIDFAYDILNRLTQETTPLGTVSYQYDVLGRRTQMVANGQQPTSYQYDAASRLTRVEQGSLFAALGYDNANRRTSLGYSNNTTTSYAYDLASRLTSITHNGPSGVIEALTYTYDVAGNRLNQSRANGTASALPNPVTAASYDAANEQTAFAGATLTYDANGNLTNDGVNTYQWDTRNRLIGMNGVTSASFAYDPVGRRVTKTVNGVPTRFAYDGKDITSEISGGAVGANYLRSRDIDEPFIRQSDAGNEHYHADILGNTLALSSDTQALGAAYTYEPFGETVTTGGSRNTFLYTGREQDDTGLLYYRARYYSPVLKRFLSQDPIGISGGLNLYRYARNNPTRFTDPQGLFVPLVHKIIAKTALKLEGCSDDFANKVAQADADADSDPAFPTTDPKNAHWHGQQGPNDPTAQAAMRESEMHIRRLMGSGTIQGLGGAMHSTEDPFSDSHGWSPALPDDFTDPINDWNWIQHVSADMFPSDDQFWSAVSADRRLIQQWKQQKGRGKDSCQ